MNDREAVEKFKRWFAEPIEKLRELPNGDGGFVAFMVALVLYERLIVARLKLKNQSISDDLFKKEMADDLRLSDIQRRVFWDMLRNGLLHHAMPKAGKTGYLLHDSFSGYPEFKMLDGNPVVCINPWKFVDRVLQEFLANPRLIVASESFPLASIVPIPFDKLI